MIIKRIVVLIGLTAVAAGCATKESTYWTEKSGIAVVHHVVGKQDHVEKLTDKQLTSAEVAAANLPAGHKYFKVVDSQTGDAKAVSKPKKEFADAKDKDPKDKLADKIDDLRRQVDSVVAENRRLEDQINAQQLAGAQAGAQATPTPEDVRMSQ